MLEVLISLKYKRLFPETYEIGNDESDIATWKKILEIKHQAHKHFLPDADSIWVGEASEYKEEEEEELVDKTLDQLAEDVSKGDFTAIAELLEKVEPKYLSGYLAQQSKETA